MLDYSYPIPHAQSEKDMADHDSNSVNHSTPKASMDTLIPESPVPNKGDPMTTRLADKIDYVRYAWKWTDDSGKHATTGRIYNGLPVVSPMETSMDCSMDLDLGPVKESLVPNQTGGTYLENKIDGYEAVS
jgi:hypothetical protein